MCSFWHKIYKLFYFAQISLFCAIWEREREIALIFRWVSSSSSYPILSSICWKYWFSFLYWSPLLTFTRFAVKRQPWRIRHHYIIAFNCFWEFSIIIASFIMFWNSTTLLSEGSWVSDSNHAYMSINISKIELTD